MLSWYEEETKLDQLFIAEINVPAGKTDDQGYLSYGSPGFERHEYCEVVVGGNCTIGQKEVTARAGKIRKVDRIILNLAIR